MSNIYKRTFHRCSLPSFGSFGHAASEEIFRNRSIRNKNHLWWPCLLMELGRNEQSLQRTAHRCFLPSFGSFDQAVSEEKLFQKSNNKKQELSMTAMFVNGSKRNEQFPQRTFHRCFLPSFGLFGQAMSVEDFQKLTNQKKELSVVAMFVNRLGQNEQSL